MCYHCLPFMHCPLVANRKARWSIVINAWDSNFRLKESIVKTNCFNWHLFMSSRFCFVWFFTFKLRSFFSKNSKNVETRSVASCYQAINRNILPMGVDFENRMPLESYFMVVIAFITRVTFVRLNYFIHFLFLSALIARR